MLERYLRIKQHLEKIPAILSFMLAPAEDVRVKQLCELHKPAKSVTLALQKSDMDMGSARFLLDGLIKSINNSFDACKKYVHMNSTITKNKVFENGIVKITNEAELSLSVSEALALKQLRNCADIDKVELDQENETPIDFATEVLKKQRLDVKTEKYVDCSLLMPTSNHIERLFSAAGIAYDDLRKNILPVRLEQQIFLVYI